MRNAIVATATTLALAACSGGDDAEREGIAEEQQADDRANTDETARPGPAGDDSEPGSDAVMQGEWFAREDAALFGPPESEAAFSVRCDGGGLVFTRSAMEPEGPTRMTLYAGGETRTIDATSSLEPLPTVTGSLPASADFAATLARADGNIAVSVDGGPTFRMPPSAALRDVVGNCS